MMSSIRTNLGGTLPGFAAQGLTLAAAIFPIFIGRDDVLVYLLTVTAPVTIIVHAVVLGAQTRLPMAEETQCLTRLSSSLSGILLASACLSMAFVYFFLSSNDLRFQRVVLGIFLLLPCQALYSLLLALATAELAYSKLMYARLFYGVFTFVGTFIAGLLGAPPLTFLAMAALGYLCGAIPIVWRRLSWTAIRKISTPVFSFCGFGTEISAARYVIAASLVSGLGSQIGALVIPLVPSHEIGAWAAVVRIMSGLQTVGGQILGPKLDIGFVAGTRHPSSGLIKRIWHRGLIVGTCLGAVCVVSTGVAVAWIDWSSFGISLAVAIVGYSATSVFLAPIDRSLTLLGGQRERLVWDVVRAVAGMAIVVWAPSNLVLIILGAVGAGSLLSYLFLLGRRAMAAAD
jgi:hypothetical protein